MGPVPLASATLTAHAVTYVRPLFFGMLCFAVGVWGCGNECACSCVK
jgi:hypothetical protein